MRNLYSSFLTTLCVLGLLAGGNLAHAAGEKPLNPRTSIITSIEARYALTADAGLDTTLPLKQLGEVTTLPLNGSASGGTVSSWKWTQLTGNSVTIADANAQSTSASGFEPGYYSFQLTVVSGATTATDIINVKVVDYQKKGESPCRSGAPKTWNLAANNNGTIFYPYLRRDGYDIQGGDTIKIPGGTYGGVSLGDFGGSTGCPVVVVPSSTVTITGSSAYFRLGSGIGDTNFVSHVNVDGMYLQSKGIKYGFQFINSAPSPSTIGITENLVTDAEVSGFYLQNTGVGVMAKLLSDSTRPWRVYNNFCMKNLKFHDIYIFRTTGEAMYLGHTSPQGDAAVQADNDGPTVRIDSIEVTNIAIDSSGWDGIQVSNAVYASIHDNIIIRSGVSNVGSQRAWIIMGGNTTGKIYNNIGYNIKEGIRGTPYGTVEIYNNYADSVKIGGTTDDGVYATGIATGPGTNVLEPRALFKPNAHDNIFCRVERFAINFPNSYGYNAAGTINNNYFVDASKTAAALVGTALDAVSNNVVYKTFPVSMKHVGSVSIGPKIWVQQNDSTTTFTSAASCIAFIKCRLLGTCTVAAKPTANAGADQTITLPVNQVTLTGTGTGSGTLKYAWTKISGPTTYTIVSATAASTKVSGLVAGVYSFTFKVTDSLGQTAIDTVQVTVNAATNVAPVADAGADQTITLPTSSVSLDGSGSTDSDGSIVTYAWTQVSGPVTATIATPAAATTTVSGLTTAGDYVFKLTVTDNSGATATSTVQVTVNAAGNVAPTANAGTAQSITLPTSSASLNGSGSTDSDGSIVTYAWTQVSGPVTATIATPAAATTTVSGLTTAGSYVFRLKVTDNGGATATATVTITVNAAANVAPIANAGSDQTITLPTSSVTLDGSGSTDSDGSIASYTWSEISGPSAATIGSVSGQTTVVSGLVEGVYEFQLKVKDNSGATATATVTVTVNPKVNEAPVADAGSPQTITLPTSSVTLDGSGSYDPDGTIASYSWTQVSGPGGITIVSANTATPNVSGLTEGTYVFQLKVTDNSGATATDQVTIIVKAAATVSNLVANAGNDTTIAYSDATSGIVLNGSGSTDAGGTITSYSWTQLSGPSTATIASATSVQTAVTGLKAGYYQFQLTVQDNNGLTSTATVTITVIDNLRTATQAFIYPNPAHDIVHIKVSNAATGKMKINLLDINGRIVKVIEQDKSVTDVDTTMDVSSLASGVYIVNIIVGDASSTVSKLVKQ